MYIFETADLVIFSEDLWWINYWTKLHECFLCSTQSITEKWELWKSLELKTAIIHMFFTSGWKLFTITVHVIGTHCWNVDTHLKLQSICDQPWQCGWYCFHRWLCVSCQHAATETVWSSLHGVYMSVCILIFVKVMSRHLNVVRLIFKTFHVFIWNQNQHKDGWAYWINRMQFTGFSGLTSCHPLHYTDLALKVV